ncbi:MAG: hypothetical protein KDK34_03600 [Leptospiraceae bacterium]|nr:hypothetical protein [Leptospiraceae bacterium]
MRMSGRPRTQTENPADAILKAARVLNRKLKPLRFSDPVTHVYNPLEYAYAPYELYVRKFANGNRRIVFMGMNPGPFGMAQTGIPFGEINMARDWLQVEAPVKQPPHAHPRRPIQGFACPRSEVSGQRLWGLFRERFGTTGGFFKHHFVINYCPLVFMKASGENFTPDKLPVAERTPLLGLCDDFLRAVCVALQPEWLVGVGRFAEKQARQALADHPRTNGIRIATVLHPSPASPAANKDWAGTATRQLIDQGIWKQERAHR